MQAAAHPAGMHRLPGRGMLQQAQTIQMRLIACNGEGELLVRHPASDPAMTARTVLDGLVRDGVLRQVRAHHVRLDLNLCTAATGSVPEARHRTRRHEQTSVASRARNLAKRGKCTGDHSTGAWPVLPVWMLHCP